MPRITKLIFVFLAAGMITACAGEKKTEPVAQAPTATSAETPAEAAAAEKEQVFEATPGLSARDRFRKSIRLLETGQAGQAKAELDAYLKEVPNSTMAQDLEAQITTPIDQYFPADNFTVTLQTGDSLSTLAKSYLGDALKFYALARYNDLTNPGQVSVGKEIRIPATKEALAARQQLATQAAAPKKEAEAPAAAEEAPAETPPPAEVAKAETAAKELTGWDKVKELAGAGDYDNAAATLETMDGKMSADQAMEAAKICMASATQLGRGNAPVAAKRSLLAGKLYLNQANKPELAMEALKLSTSLDPSNNEAQELLSSAQATVADKYYREGLVAYRNQELDKAIAKWDRVLEIDPENANASLYRAQAMDLKEKLSKMK